jgi:RNA polymerase sigma-70 factor (ECF subfamily)
MWIAGGPGVPISLAYGYQMSGFDQERTRWFLRNVLPHEPELRAWLSRSTVAGLEPDDVIQQSYAIFAEMERVDTISYPRAYLFRVARSLITRHIRRARIVPLHAIDDIERFDCPDDSPSPEQYAVDRDELRELAHAIAAMPDKMREAFILRRVHGLPQREIASQMNISENTVEKHISRGIRFLIEWFGHGGRALSRGSRSKGVEIASLDADIRIQSKH